MPDKIRHLIRELSRRHVFRVAAVYAAVAFVIFQAAQLIFAALAFPDWAFSLVVVLGLLGAPIALVLAWAYDLTPEGVIRTQGTAAQQPHAPLAGPVSTMRPGSPDPDAPSRTSVAVLPFVNLSGDPESDYFSDGITDDVITGLCKVPGLKVISRTSAMQYRNVTRNLPEIARELGVANVLEGSVRRAGGRVRVTAQLIDASSDAHVWADVYDRNLDDVLGIQRDISIEIAKALETEMSPSAEARVRQLPTRSVEAYDLYLRGRHLWNRRQVDDLRRSVGYFERALAADPGFALAAAGLADAFVILGIYGADEPEHAMRRARDAADRALQMDPGMPEALTARACVRASFDWDWSAAEREFLQVTRSAPLYGTAHQWFAMHCLAPLGRFDEALRELGLATEIDPLSPAVRASRGAVHYFAGRPAEAVAEYRTVIETHPEFSLARYFLGQALEAMGSAEAAVVEIEEAARVSGRPSEVVAALGHALASAGNAEGAANVLAELEGRAARAYVSPVLLAQVHVGLGDRARALAALERAHTQRAADLIWLGVRPVFAPLHGEPAFASLLGTVGLPAPRGVPSRR
jgi:eukaryotic-like serine/threonine-protein kinase